MKKLLISLFLFIVLFTSNSVANTPESIHEYTVDLYYANGVLASSQEESKATWDDYSRELRQKYPSLKQALKHGEAKLAYNASYLYGVHDFFESFLQYADEHPGAKITWELLKKYIEKKFKVDIGGLVEGLSNIVSESTLTEQREAYKDSVKRGHGVITVAHSQGNFFTNKVFGDITGLKSWMKPYLHMIGVASPSKSVFGGGPHVTFDNDMITAIPGNLTFTHTNPNRKGYEKADGTFSDELSEVYHGFNYYMGEAVNEHDGKHARDNVSTQKAKVDIEIYILQALAAHLQADSQWKPKKEIGCICKKKYIEVTHQFDSKEMDTLLKGQEIKSFSADGVGKIYTVDKTYVNSLPSLLRGSVYESYAYHITMTLVCVPTEDG